MLQWAISLLYLFLDFSYSFPRASWMYHLGVISLSFAPGLLGLSLGACFHVLWLRKLAFFFQDMFQKSQNINVLDTQIVLARNKPILKIVWAPIKISDKSAGPVLLSDPLYRSSLARGTHQCVSEFMYLCMKHLISTYSEVWRLFYITVSGWGWDPRSVLRNTWTAVMWF